MTKVGEIESWLFATKFCRAYLILTDTKSRPIFMRGWNYNLFLFSKETTYYVTVSYVHNTGYRYSEIPELFTSNSH